MWQQKRWQRQLGAAAAMGGKGCFTLEPLPGVAFGGRSAPDFGRGKRQPVLSLDSSIKVLCTKKPHGLGKPAAWVSAEQSV